MVVQVRVDLDRGRVQAGLVRERRRADVRLVRVRRDVGQFGRACETRIISASAPSGSTGRFILVVRLPTTANRSALPARSRSRWPCTARGSRRPAPRRRCWPRRTRCRPGSGCRCGSRRGRRRPARRPRCHGQHAAVGVAQHDDVGTGRHRRLGDPQPVVAVGGVPVEECSQSRKTRRPWSTSRRTVSATMARFSSRVVRSARSTCRTSDLATRVMTSARNRAARAPAGPRRPAPRPCGWLRTRPAGPWSAPARRRWPGGEEFRVLGIAPGQPPSMNPTPSSSSRVATAILSATE